MVLVFFLFPMFTYATLFGLDVPPGVAPGAVCLLGKDCFLNDTTIYGDFRLNNTVYDDLRFPANILKIQGASNIPEYTNFIGNIYELAFDDTTMEQVFLTMQLPHNRQPNSALMPHFHWSPSINNTGYITWCMEYVCSNVEEFFDTTTTTKCVNDTVNEEIYKHKMTPMIHIENNYTESAMCSIRLYRDTENDNLVGDAWLLEFDIHYVIDRLGEDYYS